MYNITSQLGLISFEEMFNKAKGGTDCLLVLSGGLDSAYVLWKYAQVVKDRPIYAHHIHLYPSTSDRLRVEDFAVEQQIRYLDAEVSLKKSVVDTSDPTVLVRDFTLGAILSAEIALQRGCKFVVLGDDLISSARRQEEDATLDPLKVRMNMAMAEYVRASTADNVSVCMGMDALSVKDAYEEMPEDYLALVSSCRKPTLCNGFVKQCGHCHSCNKNRDFGFLDKISTRLKWPDQEAIKSEGFFYGL